jgi:uncharacterized membrane protein (GlpM family)
MGQVGVLALRGLAGGALVVAFSLLSELLRPKSFAGILAAAPSIAIASLLVTDGFTGGTAVQQSALGMVAGAVALVAACVVAIDSVKRFRALRGSLAAIAVWLAAAAGLYVVALR